MCEVNTERAYETATKQNSWEQSRSQGALPRDKDRSLAYQEWLEEKYEEHIEKIARLESFKGESDDMNTLLKKSYQIFEEMLSCKNNDCRCRLGYGVCNQCRESANDLMDLIDKEIKERNS